MNGLGFVRWRLTIVMNDPNDNTKTLRARIVSGSVVLLSGSALVTVINLAYNVAVARFLGPQGFGHATVVYTLLTIVSALTLSFQILTTKVVAQQSADGKGAVYRDLHRASWVCGLLVAALLIVFQHGITNYLNLPSSMLIVLLAIGSAFYIPLGTRRGYIQGECGFRGLATNLVLEGAVRLGGSLLLVMMGYGVKGVIAANAAAMLVSYLAIPPRLAAPAPNPLRLGHAIREASQAIVFFSGQVLINNCDIVLVLHFLAPTAAGLYSAVAMVGRVIFAFTQAVMNSMFPVVAGSREEERRSLSLIATSLLLVLAIGGVMALVLRIMPASVWTTFLGSGFRLEGHHGLSYMLALYAVTTVIYSLSVVMITYEMSYKIANTSWVQFLFSAVLIAGIGRFHSSIEEVIIVRLVLMIVLLLLVGVPFFSEALRKARRLGLVGNSQIRLIRRVSEDEVLAEFLKSDFAHDIYRPYHEMLRSVVFSPDLDNEFECAKRRAVLFLRHRSLWKELPRDTEWYEVEVKEADIGQIRFFPRAHWRRIARGHFEATEVLERVRTRAHAVNEPFHLKISQLRERFLEKQDIPSAIVLIGLNEAEPLTILDGNHRFAAAALEGRIDRLRFLCGFSPDMTGCCWYRTNIFTLARYGRNLLRHLIHHPEAELNRLFESSG
jgi:O-antigen/teichoic acid export membrane protein